MEVRVTIDYLCASLIKASIWYSVLIINNASNGK